MERRSKVGKEKNLRASQKPSKTLHSNNSPAVSVDSCSLIFLITSSYYHHDLYALLSSFFFFVGPNRLNVCSYPNAEIVSLREEVKTLNEKVKTLQVSRFHGTTDLFKLRFLFFTME